MSSFEVDSIAMVNHYSAPNTGRLVKLIQDVGEQDLGVEFGIKRIWKIEPIDPRPLMTRRTPYPGRQQSKVYYLPEQWLVPITIHDPDLDMFLLGWAHDEMYYRTDGDVGYE